MWSPSEGSILGPLLFLLYINHITASSSFEFFLFADDTSIFFSHNDNPDADKIINRELQKISDWLSANKLSLNVGKSQLLSFSLCSKPMVTISIIRNYSGNTRSLGIYLGILINNKLQWKDQINSINLKLSNGVGLLIIIRHFFTKSVLRSIYFSFVYPRVDYNL